MEQAAMKVGVLGERNMRWYLGGQLLSLTGNMLQVAVLSLLVLSISKTNGPFWVGVVGALDLAPGAVLGPLAGMLLDALDKRRVLIVTASCGIAQSLTLAFLTYVHHATLVELLPLGFCMGIINSIDGPGRNAIIKDAVVHEYNVRPASKMFSSLYTLAQVAGPGLAGFLILYAGYPITFVLNAASFAALIIVLLNMHLALKTPPAMPKQSTSVKAALGVGIRYILENPAIKACIMLIGAITFFGYFYYPILAVIARDLFNGGPITYSYLAAASGIGALCGSLVIINLDKIISHRTMVIGGIIGMGLALLTLSQTSYLPVGIGLLAIIGFCFMVSFSSLRSSLIHLVAGEQVGVVLGYSFTFFYGGMVLGALCAGSISNVWGAGTALVAGGTILTAVGCVTPFLSGIRKLD